MANLIIKSSADNLVLQGSDASPAITVGATGTTTFAENATLSGTANNLGTVTAGTLAGTVTYPTGTVIGSKMTMVRDQKSLTLTGGNWHQLTWLNVDYQAAKITSDILITLTINALSYWGGTTQAWRFTVGGSLAGNAGTDNDGSDFSHGSDIDYGFSDNNHCRVVNVTANLGNPSTIGSALTYGVQYGVESGGTGYFGNDAGGHSGAIIGTPSPSFLMVQELSGLDT